MRYLFIHQNFPAQFVHLAAELARLGHEVVALASTGRAVAGVKLVRYRVDRGEPAVLPHRATNPIGTSAEHLEKLARAVACAHAMTNLSRQGLQPDVIIAHPGWGEALYCADVWPAAKLLVFSEFYYNAQGSDFDFDPEFRPEIGPTLVKKRFALRLKNTVLLHALQSAHAAYAPTHWQHQQLPIEFQAKTRIAFDGIDTERACPNPAAQFVVPSTRRVLTRADSVITFVNRNLEPYRGFHRFMRALPHILAASPSTQVLIVGKDSVSYGSPPAAGGTWRESLINELGSAIDASRVHFIGALPYADYIQLLQISTCHVYLTYPFVLSWSCLEAMSAGCVVVGSRTAPVEEVIEHGQTGWLVDFFDHQQLAQQVCEVLKQRATDLCGYQMIATQARAHVVKHYDLRTRCLPAQLAMVERLSPRQAVA